MFEVPEMRETIVIETLTSETIRQVARRLSSARTFEEFVYRESEMDALFTLADIAITTSRESDHPLLARGLSIETLKSLRKLIFGAHDATHDNDVSSACNLLEEAAQLLDGSL